MRGPREDSIQLGEVQSPGRVVEVDNDSGGQDGGSWVVEALQVNSITELPGVAIFVILCPALSAEASHALVGFGVSFLSSMTTLSPSKL